LSTGWFYWVFNYQWQIEINSTNEKAPYGAITTLFVCFFGNFTPSEFIVFAYFRYFFIKSDNVLEHRNSLTKSGSAKILSCILLSMSSIASSENGIMIILNFAVD